MATDYHYVLIPVGKRGKNHITQGHRRKLCLSELRVQLDVKHLSPSYIISNLRNNRIKVNFSSQDKRHDYYASVFSRLCKEDSGHYMH